MPATATDPVKTILNQAEAIVRMQPEKKDQSAKLMEIGDYVAPGTVRTGYQKAQEWIVQRSPQPSGDKILRLQMWVTEQIGRFKTKDRTIFNQTLKQVTEERA